MNLWLVGEWKGVTPWEFVGVFDTEKVAVAACIGKHYFVAPIRLNESAPVFLKPFPDCYYPMTK